MKKTIPQHHDEIENVPDIGDQDEKVVRFVLAQLIAVGLRILGADQGALLLVDQGGRTLRFAMVAGPDGLPPDGKAGSDLIGHEVPIGEGVTGMAALTRDVQSAADADGSGIPFHRVHGDGKPHAVLAAPMLLDDRLVGVITAVSFNRRQTFSPSQAQTYGILANAAAGIVDDRLRRNSLRNGQSSSWLVETGDVGEQSLLREVLALARKRPRRVDALRRIVAAMEDFDET